MINAVLVDDEILTVQALKKIIHCSGLDVNVVGEAYNGEEALKIIRESRVDLAIVDIRMPILNGMGLMKALKEEKFFTKTIILSAYRDFEYAQQAISFGACGYLVKPIDEKRLLELLREIIIKIDEDKINEQIKKVAVQAIGDAKVVYITDTEETERIEILLEDSRIIEKVKKYCDMNFGSDISLGTVSDFVCMSKSYLSTFFKRKTGFNFWDYLTKVRIDKAKILLETTEIKVNRIAEDVGYKNSSHFGRIFKELVGVTPAEYKENVR